MAIDQDEPAAQKQGHDGTDLQYQAIGCCHSKLKRAPRPHFEREGFATLGMWSVLVVQSEQHVIYRLMEGGGREAQADMEETDGEGLP